MPGRYILVAASVTLAVCFHGAAAAQAPRITNTRLAPQPAGDLPRTFESLVAATPDARWVGYRVPAVDGDRGMCCADSGHGVYVSGAACCGTCRLESGPARGVQRNSPPAAGPIPLEGSDRMVVLVRLADRQVHRIGIYSDGCELDAGGLPVVWLEDVQPADSVALLESLASAGGGHRVVDGAVAAIALHRGEAADASLGRLSMPDRPESVRKKVTFWLGQARGATGLSALQRILREDPSVAVRRAAVFGVSQSGAPGALEALIATARGHDEPRVRAQAVFWLGQKAGARAAEAITERIEQDPDTDVKKRAVFALSQMPKDEGVPLLIEVARTNRNPAVRKQAMFWLAQSGDPRAIDFFASILK